MSKKVKMLYDYITAQEDGAEITVNDKDYFMESYFYNDDDMTDSWNNSMIRLSKLLKVEKVVDGNPVVNLSELIENHIDTLKKSNLFIRCNIDDIMGDMENIISGYVSEEWMEKFVNALSE